MPRYFLNRNRGLFSELEDELDEELFYDYLEEDEFVNSKKGFINSFKNKINNAKSHYKQSIENEKEYYASSDDLRFKEQSEKNEQFLKKILFFSIGTIFILFLLWLFFR